MTVICDVMPCDLIEGYKHSGETCCISSVFFSTMKTKARGSSKMLAPIYQTTQHHIPGDLLL